ncbi:hypothetical protein C8R46DRAFT_1305945, partial [Mycena filopes]
SFKSTRNPPRNPVQIHHCDRPYRRSSVIPFLNHHREKLVPVCVPSLPIELQREIVEIAIRTNPKDRAVKLNLSLVAHHFQFWVDRVFYESVSIFNSKQLDQFLNLVHVKPAGFFATIVKVLSLHFHFRDISADARMARVLDVCPGVQALQCFSVGSPCISGLPLRRLYTDMSVVELLNSTVEPTWCLTLTHLDLGSPNVLFDLQLAQMLGRLPCLTHIALHASSTTRSLIDVVCTSCLNLRVLVIFAPEEELDTVEYRDASHVVLIDDTLEEEWDAGLFSHLPDFWIRDENVVAARKLASTPSSSFKCLASLTSLPVSTE